MNATEQSTDHQQTEQAIKAAANSVPLPFGLLGIVKDFGIVVCLVWYLWFTQTSSIPETQRAFHDLLIKEREVFRIELDKQRTHDEKRNTEVVRAMTDLVIEMRRLKTN
jgi:hypothetical protein